jgi:altronate dehydratase
MFFSDSRIIGTFRLVITQLGTITELLKELTQEQKKMAADLTVLKAQVQQNTDLEKSAITLIEGIAQQLADAKNDPAAVQGIIDELKASSSALAAAIAANTPAGPETTTP